MSDDINGKIKFGIWAMGSVIIGVFFALFIFKSIGYEKIGNKENVPNDSLSASVIDTVPEDFYFIKDPSKKPLVDADAYFVGDLDNGKMILEKNQDKVFPIASVSKLMTATVAKENYKEEDAVVMSKKALDTYGKNGNFRLNEKIRLGDLFYPLLLESSNDAAEAIALNYNRSDFIQKMNDKAKELGMAFTSFLDPSGLSEKNISTVFDLFKLARYIKAKSNDILQKTTKQSYITKKHSWFSNNQFLRDKTYLGGKSGYTDPARQTVISTFSVPLSKEGVRNIAIMILHSPDRYKDVKNILKYLNSNVYFGKESDAQMAWVKQKENGETEVIGQNFVRLSFAGDIMLDRGVKNSVLKNFGGDYSALFNNLEILKSEDIAFANLEGPVSDQGKDKHNLYSFRMDPSVVPALKGAGLSILSIANNHVGDWGHEAYIDTMGLLKENELLYTGGGMNEAEAVQPTIIKKYGMKIGYLGFSDKGPEWMASDAENPGLLLASNPRFDDIIKNASKQVDYLIVSFHFGEEYQNKHNQRQEYLAHSAIDDGAKIVIGHHPHVIQDTEVYKNSFIAYSLGNFIFDQAFSSDTMEGLLLEVKLSKDGSMAVKKNIVKLSRFFQPAKIIKTKEEKLKFK